MAFAAAVIAGGAAAYAVGCGPEPPSPAEQGSRVSAVESATDLRERLRRGENLEVAGYEISEAMARSIGQVKLGGSLGPHLGALHWMEVTRDPQAELPTPSAQAVSQARAAGLETRVEQISGEPFWSSTEIVCNEALVRSTIAALS